MSITNYGMINSRLGYPSMEYNGYSILDRASLWIGGISNNGITVSCGEGNHLTTCSEWHTGDVDSIRVNYQNSGKTITYCTYTDTNIIDGHTPIGLVVEQRTYSWGASPFVIIDLTIKAVNNNSLTNLYIGLMCDFDIPAESGNMNERVGFSMDNKLSYAYSGNKYAGVRMLTHQPTSHSIWDITNDPHSDIEKYGYLSNGIFETETDSGYDYRFLQGVGPFQIGNGNSIRIAYAFIGSNNLESLKGKSISAQNKFDSQIINSQSPSLSESNVIKENIVIKKNLPQNFDISQNYPNPFNPQTEIRYALPKQSKVSLKVYNTSGQLVRTLVNDEKQAGYYNIIWDGRDDSGNSLSSGLYLYHIVAGEFQQTRKMMLLK